MLKVLIKLNSYAEKYSVKTKVFIPFCLVLLMAIYIAYTNFKVYFAEGSDINKELVVTREQLEKEKLKTAMAFYELESMRQQVAVALPGDLTPKQYSARNIASVSRSFYDKPLDQFTSEKLFRDGKELFRKKQFKKSNQMFGDLIKQNKYSVHLPEAYFLLVEGLFQIEDYEACLERLNVMINQFPDHELTGYAMLRMGQIYEKRERLDDAKSIYTSVAESFKNKQLKKQAQQLLSALSL